MAGVEWGGNGKWTKGALKSSGFKRHFDLLIREMTTHSNPDIDVSRTRGDCYLDPLGRVVDDPHYWKQIRNNILDEVKRIDEKYPPLRVKADRKIAQGLTIYIPEGVDPVAYSQDCITMMTKLGHHIAGAELHVDEQHEYTDPKTKEKRMSMIHLHVFEVPYAEWTEKTKDGTKVERKGVNMKHYATVHRIKELNKALDEMSLQLYGVSMMTGEGTKKERLSIEDAKVASKKAELEKIEQDIKVKSDELTIMSNALASQTAQKKANKLKAEELSIKEEELSKQKAILDQRQRTIDADDLRIAQDKASLSIEKKQISTNVESISSGMDYTARHTISEVDKLLGSAIFAAQHIRTPEGRGHDLVSQGMAQVKKITDLLRDILIAFLQEIRVQHHQAMERLKSIPLDQGDVTPRVQEIVKENKMAYMDNEKVYHAAVRIYDKKFSERLEREGLDLPYTRKESAEAFAQSFINERQKNPELSFGDLYRKAAEDIKQKFEDHYTFLDYKPGVEVLDEQEIVTHGNAVQSRQWIEEKAQKYANSILPMEAERVEKNLKIFDDFCAAEHVADPLSLLEEMLEHKINDKADFQGMESFVFSEAKMKDILKPKIPEIEIEQPHAHMSMGM